MEEEREESLLMTTILPVSIPSPSLISFRHQQRVPTKNMNMLSPTTTTSNPSNTQHTRKQRQHSLKEKTFILGFIFFVVVSFLFVQNLWSKHHVIIPPSINVKKNENATKTTTKIGLVSYCAGDKFMKLKKLIRYNRQIYADQYNNIEIFEGNSTIMPIESFITPPAWLKVAYLYQLLSSTNNNQNHEIEWFVWVDCDAIIARYDISIESLLQSLLSESNISDDDYDDNINNNLLPVPQINNVLRQPHHYDIIVSDDKPIDSPFNTGVMFIRNNNLWTKQFFQRALLLSKNLTIRYHKWWEQKAFNDLYSLNEYNEQSHFLVVPNGRSIFNGFAGMNKPYKPSYIDNTTFIWHRVHCNTTTRTTINDKDNDDDCCFNFSISFFCSKTPPYINGRRTYPKDYCKGIQPWKPPSKTNHC